MEVISINKNKEEFIFLGLLIIPIIWLAILIAPYMDQGLIYALPHFNEALKHPLDLHLGAYTFKTISIFMLFYVLGIGIYLSSPKNYRSQQEYGAAKWQPQILYVKNMQIKIILKIRSYRKMYEWDWMVKSFEEISTRLSLVVLVQVKQESMPSQTFCRRGRRL